MTFIRLLILVLLNRGIVLYAQTGGQFIEASEDLRYPFTVTQYSTKHGLPENQATDIIQKANGLLVITTANGVVEYNGSEFTPLLDNFYNSRIFARLSWHEGTRQLFAEGYGGPTQLLYPRPESYDWCMASALVGDSLYGLDYNGELRCAHVKDLKFHSLFRTNLRNAYCMTRQGNYCYVGCLTGIYRVDLRDGRSEMLLDGVFNHVKVNPYTGSVFAVGLKEVFEFNGKKPRKILDFRDSTTLGRCEDIEFVGPSQLYVATTFGLYRITPGGTVLYDRHNGLPSNSVHSVLYDRRENCLFVGTGEKGLLKLEFKSCFSYSLPQGFRETSSLGSIVRAPDGTIITGGNQRHMLRVDPDTVYPYADITGLHACLAVYDSTIFIGTWGGGLILVKNKKEIKTLWDSLELPSNSVHAVFKDSRGYFWIGTSAGIARGKTVNGIRPFLKGKIEGRIITFCELKNGTVCIGGSKGMYQVDRNDRLVAHVGEAAGLEGKEIRSFYEDARQRLWIGTYNGGLYCFARGKLRSINRMRNAMLGADVFCLAKDNLGYLFITSNHGLWRLKEQDLSDFYEGKREYLVPYYYGEETGILNTEFNGGFQNNYLKLRHNRFYFPTIQGLVFAIADVPKYRKLLPTISRVFVNDTLNRDTSHVFRRNTYSLQFDFSCVTFLNKYNVYYQYKLEGGSTADWSPLQRSRSVTFKLLPAGKYKLTVRAIDAFNEPHPFETSFSFEIKPYFYEMLWFRIAVVLAIVLLVALALRIRIISQRRKIEEKEFYRRKISEVELNALQAQLNPHFIFNCMNTIKFFILEKDFTKANEGLNRLSRLIRSSLENSEDMFVPLEQELTFVQNYVELEKMRLQQQLEYAIRIDDTIDRSALIPHLLIQPHVENAIKHGIANLENRVGFLDVHFSREDRYIVCEITDNGIGRKAAAALSSNNEFKSSKGTQLSKEKSFLLNRYYHYNCSIAIVDLYDENGKGCGTKVTIKLSANYENSDR